MHFMDVSTVMASVVLSAASVGTQTLIIRNGGHLMCILLLVCCSGLLSCNCFLVSHGSASAAAMGQPLDSSQLEWTQSHADIPRSGRHRSILGNTRSNKRSSPSTRVHSDKYSNRTSPPAEEVEALAAFKAAITIDPDGALSSWIVGDAASNGSDPCTAWVGVTCSPKFPNNVVDLDLSSLQLGGSLSSALHTLGNLRFLHSLDLSMNVFSGPIGEASIANISHLSYFNFSWNLVTGAIPSGIGGLVNLTHLDFSQNNISGVVPDALANCSLLMSINLGANLLHGDIPAWIGSLAGLQQLNFSHNDFSGAIPSGVGNCSSLRVLDLNGNTNIVGSFPQEMSMLKHLQIVRLDHCYIAGDFPVWIANLTSLSAFSIYDAPLSGEIPESIGLLKFLKYFGVSVTMMTGVLPLSLCNLTSLTHLGIQQTNIGGHIPPQIGTLRNLQVLGLAGNQLIGTLPSSLANLSTLLTFLELGQNKLDAAPFPQWIESLTGLTILFFSFMNLQGDLPEATIGKLSQLEYLLLGSNNLTGKLPSTLSNCTYLSLIDVGHNRLSGDISSALGQQTTLALVNLFDNHFTGPYPEFIANWTELQYFDISQNHLSGLLDGRVRIDMLRLLYYFSLLKNDFEGPIPETLGNSTSLVQLGLSDNRLSGPIPSSLGNLTSLQILDLGNNKLQGGIPVSLLQSALQIGELSLFQNQLEGSIPEEIGHLTQVSNLDLSNNNFTGIVPSSLGNCSNVGRLDLSGNHFEGNVPAAAISKMSSSLKFLNLSGNLFTGSWPKELINLKFIENINISSNQISGSIVVPEGQWVNLNSLDVSSNNFTGEIPQALGSLANLQFFNASFNNFTGPIPQGGIFNSSRINESSFLGNPGLCGPVATVGLSHQQCAAIPLNVSSNGRHCHGFSCKKVWIPVAVVSTLVALSSTVWITILLIPIFRRGERLDDDSEKVLFNFDAQVRYTEKDVLQTIQDPTADNVIGVGGRSVVYRGVLPGGQVFALKRLILPDHDRAVPTELDNRAYSKTECGELVREAKIMAKLRHKNILKCLSFFSNLEHKVLIIEYMPEGSLHKHLHEMGPCRLTWEARLKVALGVAEGMKYLHHDFPEPLIHRDLKPSNILLDANLEPKICDFGISKFVGGGRAGEASASTFCGTIGYMPPEYANQTWVSTQGDVFSYGMVLIELLTHKQPCSMDAAEDQSADVRDWILASFDEKPLELFDQALVQECAIDPVAKEQMLYLLRVSLFCTTPQAQSRPCMINILGMLMFIKNLGVEPAVTRTVEELAHGINPTVWGSEQSTPEGAEFDSNQ